MQARAYEGYFESGKFYTAGQPLQIPERKRVFIAILDDIPNDIGKEIAWCEFKQMAEDTACENALLDNDAFLRRDGGRELIEFLNEV